LFKYFFENLKKIFKPKRHKNSFQKEVLEKVESLQKQIGFKTENTDYYIKAITHRSFLELNPDLEKSNERLEFLGDSVLNMIIATYLFENYTEEEEGFLTKARSALVNRERLYQTADKLHLNDYIMYNHKYLSDSVEGLHTIMADTLEAVIGAIFLDKGLTKAEEFVLENIVYLYEDDESFLIDKNYKGQLLEYTHAKRLEQPSYIVTKIEGPEHKREFTIEVYIGSTLYGVGKGRSKKSAEQDASRLAISRIRSKK
jgi:ribonuclease-3